MQNPSLLDPDPQAQVPAAAGPSAPALNPTKALLDGGNMSIKDILDLPREQRCPFPSGNPRISNDAGDKSRPVWKKDDWKKREYMDIVCTRTNELTEYKLFCFNCTLKKFADPAEADTKPSTNKWIVGGFKLDFSKIKSNRGRIAKEHEDSEDHISATAWIDEKRSESPSNKKRKKKDAPHHIVPTSASVENEVEKANIEKKINETNAWAEKQCNILRQLSKTGTIEDFAQSIEFRDVGRRALYKLKAKQPEDKNKLESWGEQWARDLDAEGTLKYENANRLDACRKVALDWLYGVANLCYDFKEKSYKPAWGTDGKHVKETIKAEHVMPLLDRCLFMDRAKALYFLKINWYSEDQVKTLDSDYSKNQKAPINKRYKWILENLLPEENTTRYNDLLKPTKMPPPEEAPVASIVYHNGVQDSEQISLSMDTFTGGTSVVGAPEDAQEVRNYWGYDE